MKCTRCKWHKNQYVNLAPFDGNPNADVVFVGEAYGKTEVDNFLMTKEHKCFVGKAGHKFEELLKEANLLREMVAVLNSVRCFQPGNPTPTKRDMDACFIYTQRDIKSINPKLVVAMGSAALYQTTGKDRISRYTGKLIWSDKLKCNVYCTYHPAACIYDPDKWIQLKNDFARIPALFGKDSRNIKHYKYTYITTLNHWKDFFSKLQSAVSLGWDIETTGLDPIKEKLVLVQFITPDKEIFVVDSKLLNLIKQDLEWICNNKPISGQDFAFDSKFFYHQLGFMPEIFDHDSCLAEFLLTGMKDNDLTFLTGKYVPESFGYDDIVYAHGGFHRTPDKKIRLQYAADDVGVLPVIKRKQTRALMKSNQYWLFKNITMPCNKVLTKMSNRGVLYNIDALNYADAKYSKMADDCLNKVKELDSIKACQRHFNKLFNPRSPDMIKWLILEYYQLPVLKETNKGKPSIGKEEMKKYAEDPDYNNEYCQIMGMYRSYQNIRDNFLSGTVPKLYDNVAHTSYSLHATTTGRPNSKNPNLLNIPRKDKDIKRIYIARPGYIYVYADLSQIEVRVAAMLSQDPNLIKICNTAGQDFHCAMTAKIYNMTYDEVYQGYINSDARITELRNKAKTITFGILYGMTVFGLSYRLGMSVKKAEIFIKKYFEPFSDLESWIEQVKDFVIRNGFVETYFKFKRFFPNYKTASEMDIERMLREACNMPVQGTAWNLMQLIMISVDKQLEHMKSGCLMQIYDALIIETLESEVDKVANLLYNTMCTINKPFDILNTVQMKTDVEVGYNLAELEKYNIKT